MIWTIKVQLILGAWHIEGPWEGTVEIESSSTLEELHQALQRSLDFDNDHLYEFYIARNMSSRKRIIYNDENEYVYELTLEDIFPLGKNKTLFYLFDYGDSWIFKINKSRKKPKDPVQTIKYPRLIEEKGVKPKQYYSQDLWE